MNTKIHYLIYNINMDFSEWLVEEMGKREWSQSDLARKLKVTRGAVNNLLSGRSKTPDKKTMEEIARAFNVPLEVVYQKAKLLPTKSTRDELEEEATYLFSKLKDKQTALKVLRALGAEDNEEKQTNRSGSGHGHAVPR